MSKYLLIATAIFTLSLYANEANIEAETSNGSTTIELMNKCDKVYDDCAVQCENSKDVDNDKCYAQCEAKYDLCLQDDLIQNQTENSN